MKVCTNLGGKMAFEFGQDFKFTIGDPTECDQDPTYWIPVVFSNYSKGQYQWSWDIDSYNDQNDLSIINWSNSQPNEYGIGKCVGLAMISGKYYANDISCGQPRCSVCRVPVVHSYYFRGPGLENMLASYNHPEIPNFLDREYSLLLDQQRNSSKLVFEGQTGLSQIIWYPNKKTNVIKRYDNKDIMPNQKTFNISYNMDPFGHFLGSKWIFTHVRSVIYVNISVHIN